MPPPVSASALLLAVGVNIDGRGPGHSARSTGRVSRSPRRRRTIDCRNEPSRSAAIRRVAPRGPPAHAAATARWIAAMSAARRGGWSKKIPFKFVKPGSERIDRYAMKRTASYGSSSSADSGPGSSPCRTPLEQAPSHRPRHEGALTCVSLIDQERRRDVRSSSVRRRFSSVPLSSMSRSSRAVYRGDRHCMRLDVLFGRSSLPKDR